MSNFVLAYLFSAVVVSGCKSNTISETESSFKGAAVNPDAPNEVPEHSRAEAERVWDEIKSDKYDTRPNYEVTLGSFSGNAATAVVDGVGKFLFTPVARALNALQRDLAQFFDDHNYVPIKLTLRAKATINDRSIEIFELLISS